MMRYSIWRLSWYDVFFHYPLVSCFIDQDRGTDGIIRKQPRSLQSFEENSNIHASVVENGQRVSGVWHWWDYKETTSLQPRSLQSFEENSNIHASVVENGQRVGGISYHGSNSQIDRNDLEWRQTDTRRKVLSQNMGCNNHPWCL